MSSASSSSRRSSKTASPSIGSSCWRCCAQTSSRSLATSTRVSSSNGPFAGPRSWPATCWRQRAWRRRSPAISSAGTCSAMWRGFLRTQGRSGRRCCPWPRSSSAASKAAGYWPICSSVGSQSRDGAPTNSFNRWPLGGRRQSEALFPCGSPLSVAHLPGARSPGACARGRLGTVRSQGSGAGRFRSERFGNEPMARIRSTSHP
mmetsp:Transcript_44476/g.128544  ORF Transcript_44476/g.128544 Transcript_44476/m.128544 type:complete len:204 (-) Transcript_44476:11-622(-)